MPPNVFRLRETGDLFTFREGKPLLFQHGTQEAKQSGIDFGKFPEIGVEEAAKRFIPGAHPNAFFDFAQTATAQDILGGGQPIQTQTLEQVKQLNQQRLEQRRSYEAQQQPQGVQTPQIQQPIDPKLQRAQQEIQRAQELQARVNQMLIKQGKQPVPIPGEAPQTSQNAPGTTQTQETTQPTSQGLQPQPQAPEPSLADEIKGIFSQMGISMPSPNQSPVTSAADVYKQFAEMTNLLGTKKDLQDLVNKKTQEVADINENPWISEGLRQKKIANIENKYQARIDALQSIFNRADEDARFLTGKYLEQIHQTQQNTQDFLFKAIDLAEKEISGRRAERKETERIREFESRQAQQERQFETRERAAEAREKEREREFETREERLERQFGERTGKGKRVTSGSLSLTSGDIGEGASELERSRGQDGNADTTLYLRMLKHWTGQGGLVQDFFKHYPPKDYLNSNDPALKEYPSIKNQFKVGGSITIE